MSIEQRFKKTSDAFRPDINGLRAWAVMAVVLYHFGVPGFQGGFVGVDIFFVISGFLMTGIIVKGVSRASFRWHASLATIRAGHWCKQCASMAMITCRNSKAARKYLPAAGWPLA